jgi:threonyl-tRNA synthetase
MKILSLHCDYLKFKPVKPALKGATLEKAEEKQVEIKEPLVIFTAIEKQDESNKSILEQYIKNILDLKEKVKAEKIVLYPYAHLSSSLSSPDFAKNLMIEAEKELKKKKVSVSRAPFGFYKEFELKCKGHPLAELSRSIGEEVSVSNKIEVSKSMKSEEVYDAKKLLNEISKTKLNREKLADNDHRIIGQNLDLFSFSEVAPGMVFWHNNGLIIYNELANYWREEHRKENYKEVKTPEILNQKLWQISGHWEKYRNNIFLTKYEGNDFAVKPMSCPGGIMIFKNTPKSYKELPLRVAELGTVHRQELSGVLGGLFRVIQFTQDDAHIYCTEEQIAEELEKVVNLTNSFYVKYGLKLDHIELSTRPEKRIGSDEIWDKAEKALENALKKLKIKYKINAGDGAFYGPKVDFHLKDSLGRTWQCGTIQLDFSMPQRFELEYTDKDSNKKRPVMIHNAIYGSLERFIGVLLEHLNGNLPTWLSPVQVRVLSFTDRNIKAAEKLVSELKEAGIRVDSDLESNTVNDKVRTASLLKIPYIITIGDKEEEKKTLAVKKRGEDKVKFGVKKEVFLKELLEEIKERR